MRATIERVKSTTGVLLGVAACASIALGVWFGIGEPEPLEPSWDEAAAEAQAASSGDARAEAELAGAAEEPDVEPLVEAELAHAEREELAAAAPAPAVDPKLPKAPVRGVLRDEQTEEPLPQFLLRIHDRAHKEDVWTDAQGRFASQTPFLAGRLRIDPLDHEARRRPAPSLQVDHEVGAEPGGAPAELALRVPCGPTYRLLFDPTPPPEAETFRAELRVAREDEQDRFGAEPLRAPRSPGPAGAGESELPWVRFPPLDPRWERVERLELRGSTGAWRGDGRASALRGVQTAPVSVRLTALASLSGKVFDATGPGIEGAFVELRPADTAQPSGRGQRPRTSTAADGTYRMEFVQPGSYVLVARTLRHERAELPVELQPGAAQQLVDAVLPPLPSAGSIRGTVVTQTGRSTPKARGVLTLADRGRPSLECAVQWRLVDGRQVGHFQFHDLPAGEFTVRIEKDDWLKWEPREFKVSAPREDLEVRVFDDLSLCDYVVRARDRDNGLPLGDLHVWLEFKNGPQRDRRCASNEVVERGVPVERAFAWRVDKAGYRFAAGDESSFQLEEMRDGRLTRIVELDLAPGWSEVFRAVRRDGKGAIEGVEVLADGVSLGKTAKNGELAVELRDPPKSVTVRHARWTLSGKIDLRPAWRREGGRRSLAVPLQPVRGGAARKQ